MKTNILTALREVVAVLTAGTDDPDASEQIAEDDENFFKASRIFLAELRREAEERGQGGWSTPSLLLALERVMLRDEDDFTDEVAASRVIRDWLMLEQVAQAKLN